MPNSRVFNHAGHKLASGDLDLDTADVRAILVMSNSNVFSLTDNALTTLSALTLDEYDGSSYARVALTSEGVTKQDGNNRVIFTSSAIAFGSIGAGTRSAIGILLYKYVDGTAANDYPIAAVAFPAATAGDGTAYTVNCPTAGWFQLSVMG